MYSDIIVRKFIKCQTESRIERTYYIYTDCKNDLIKDIDNVIDMYTTNIYMLFCIFCIFWILSSNTWIDLNTLFKPINYIMKNVYKFSLYLVCYKKNDTHDRIHKLEYTMININDDLDYKLKKLDDKLNKFYSQEYITLSKYNRDLMNMNDRITMSEVD